MATLTLSIPDELLRRAMARLQGADRADLQEYLLSVVKALATEGQSVDAETEAQLLAGLDSPLGPMSDADWSALKDRVKNRPNQR